MKKLIFIILISSLPVFAQDQAGFREWQKAHLTYVDFIKKYCVSGVKVSRNLYEEMATSLSVNPRSINLERVITGWDDITWDTWEKLGGVYDFSPRCVGTFYSPRGSHQCDLGFNEEGIIVNACKVGRLDYFSERLRASAIKLTENGRKRIKKPETEAGITFGKYDSNGRAKDAGY